MKMFLKKANGGRGRTGCREQRRRPGGGGRGARTGLVGLFSPLPDPPCPSCQGRKTSPRAFRVPQAGDTGAEVLPREGVTPLSSYPTLMPHLEAAVISLSLSFPAYDTDIPTVLPRGLLGAQAWQSLLT